jgi:hypothetical protein
MLQNFSQKSSHVSLQNLLTLIVTMAPVKKIAGAPVKKIEFKTKILKKHPPPLACKTVVGTRTGTPHWKKKCSVMDDYLDPPGLLEPTIKICCAGDKCSLPVYPIDQKFVISCERCEGMYHMICCGEEEPFPDDPDEADLICLKCVSELKVQHAEDKNARYDANPWLMRTPIISGEKLKEFQSGKWKNDDSVSL